MRLRAPGCGWGALVVSAAALLVLAAVGLALVLLLTRESKTKQKIPGLVLNDVVLVACPAPSCEKTASYFKCKYHCLLPACKKLAGSLEEEEKEAEEEVQQYVHCCVKVLGRQPKLQSPT